MYAGLCEASRGGGGIVCFHTQVESGHLLKMVRLRLRSSNRTCSGGGWVRG